MMINVYTAQLQILESLVSIYHKADLNAYSTIRQECMAHLDFLLSFIHAQQTRITGQEILDYQLETKRFEKIVHLCTAQKSVNFANAMTKPAVKKLYDNIRTNLFSIKRFTATDDITVRENLRTLCELIDKSIKLEERELKEIAQAMGMGVGHWYKCPNGHLYVIADCGGAVTTGVCNECKASIGGTGYRLAANNQRTQLGAPGGHRGYM